jgi:hypothetical protein
MADPKNDEKNEGRDSESPNTSRKTVRQVVVTHLDAPPPSGKQKIHPRRPAPVVPTREERTGEQSDQDKKKEKSDSE